MLRTLRSRSLLFILLLVSFCSTSFGQGIRLEPLPPLHGMPPGVPVGQVTAVTFHPEDGFLFIEDANQRLLHFDRSGRFVGEAGGFGFGQGSLRGPTDITSAGFEIWVADPLAGKIVRYDTWLAPREPWTEVLERGVQIPFERPVSVARAASGDAVVIEADLAEAWLLDPEARLVERVASFGEISGGMHDPRRVEIAPSGLIAVADPGRKTVFLFDRFGTPRGQRPWVHEGTGPSTVAWLGDSLWVAGPKVAVLLDPRGQVVFTLTGDEAGGPIHDLACNGEHLLVAAGTTVQRYRVVRE